jgi:nucleotide-binding universal stress UspA family protein
MPARTIVETAQNEEADMIMITSKGRGGLDYIMVGSVAQRIVENTDIPVFIVPVIEK